jgi:hypothetical protein
VLHKAIPTVHGQGCRRPCHTPAALAHVAQLMAGILGRSSDSTWCFLSSHALWAMAFGGPRAAKPNEAQTEHESVGLTARTPGVLKLLSAESAGPVCASVCQAVYLKGCYCLMRRAGCSTLSLSVCLSAVMSRAKLFRLACRQSSRLSVCLSQLAS